MINKLEWLSDPRLLIALAGLCLGFQRFRTKKGIEVRGGYVVTGSRQCDELYISEVNLENQKDRAVTIYGLYLKIGRACYITVQDFSEQPLILKAFESFRAEYGPIEFYMSNSNRLSIDSHLSNDKLRKSLYISTAAGKYRVRKRLIRWTPLSEAVKNSCTVIAETVRYSYEGHYFGSSAKYLIELVDEGESKFLTVHSNDYKSRVFRDFQLTEDSLKSADNLQQFSNDLIRDGSIVAKLVMVHDLDKWRKENCSPYGRIEVPEPNWFEYYIFNRLRTAYTMRQTTRKIKKHINEIKKTEKN